MSKIQAPAWCENAIPTLNGWEDPDSGELYVSGGFTQAQIAEWHGDLPEPDSPPPSLVRRWRPPPSLEARLEQAGLEMLTEAPVGNKSLEEMTKVELEALGRQHGIELDRRKRKNVLVETMKDLLED